MSVTRRRFVTLAASAACALPARLSWPANGGRRKLRVAFFTDVHARTEWQTPRALERAAAAINRLRPAVVLAGGDLITDGFQSSSAVVAPRWRTYMEFHRALRAPVEAAIGNHDLVAALPVDGSPAAADPRAEFRSRLAVARTYRSFDLAGYHFVVLDSIGVTGGESRYEGRIDDVQLEWLRRDLSATGTATPIVVLTHIPLLTAFYQATEGATEAAPVNRVIANNREVLETFDHHNLLLVLQGHLHVDELLRWRETTFITGGAVSGKWWRGAWHGTREGFGELTMRRDRIDWIYHHYGWQALRP